MNFLVDAKPTQVTLDCFLSGKGLTADVSFPQDDTDKSDDTRNLLQPPHLGDCPESFSLLCLQVFSHTNY